MARTYYLDKEPRKFVRQVKSDNVDNGNDHNRILVTRTIPNPDDTEEALPMHRRIGDKVEFYCNGELLTGIISGVNSAGQFSANVGERFFIERGDGFHEYASETYRKRREQMTMAKPLTIHQLNDLDDKDIIPCVEGKLIKLYEPDYKDKNGKDLSTPKQGGMLLLPDGEEHRIEFFGEDAFIDPKDYKNKTVRIECIISKGRKSGVVMDAYNPKYRKIHVTQSANIEILTAGGETNPTQPERTERREEPRKQKQQMTNDDPTAEHRIANYFRAFDLVKVEAEKRGLTDDQTKDITTTIVLSFKHGYEHRAPVFADEPQEKEVEQEKKPEPEKQKTAAKATKQEAKPKSGGWRDVIYPKTKRPLGEIFDSKSKDDRDLSYRIMIWAFTSTASEKNAEVHAGILEAAAEKRWTPRKLFLDVLLPEAGYPDTISDKSVIKMFEHGYNCHYTELPDDAWVDVLKNREHIISDIKETEEELKNSSQSTESEDEEENDDDLPE